MPSSKIRILRSFRSKKRS